ncbi:hypothetical protein [Vulcanisaeta sp. EB80]|uniref:hypothetical protein n=1 Tax=Vulcanisaeta sp. EB80 TaxID=1650660 RepID=UPI001389BB7C|nr:hypothetical protein [Vulcanisaeta sp. EB80]
MGSKSMGQRISREVFEEFYDMTKYEQGGPDIKRNHALEVIIQAVPHKPTPTELKTIFQTKPRNIE